MAGRPSTQKDFHHTWHLREWMQQSDPPKRQVDMTTQLGWPKAKASAVFHGQQYTQALVDQLAPWLNVKPYELLMKPEDAMRVRFVLDSIRVVSNAEASPAAEPLAGQKRKTG